MPRNDPGSPPEDGAAGGAGAARRDRHGDGGHPRSGDDDRIERRLRTLGSVCAVLAAAVLVTAGTIGWAAGRAAEGSLMASPPADSFLIAIGAMLLVLLASAVHRRILRPPLPAQTDGAPGDEPSGELSDEPSGELSDEPGDEPNDEASGDPRGDPEASRLRAYSWATGVSFGMLAAAAALGAVIAQSGKALFYGLVICLAALIAMMARWPRRSGFDLAGRGDRSEP
ncbi:MAG TPA: hypothetical protein VMW75_19755 [Thermoanaerobaculia bacterium]|nr:hypothetical protein [Thermoanaerobaculia bacterium]